MNHARRAYGDLMAMDRLAAGDSPLHRLPALCKLALTAVYLLTVVSFPKYDLTGLFAMVLFPILGYRVAGLSVLTAISKLRLILPILCLVGVLNPFFDRAPLLVLGGVTVSGGVISILTLVFKGIFCLLASFLLAATTPVDRLMGALRRLRVPKMLTSLLLLTFRYSSVLLNEVGIMTEAYQLRAPGQKGIHISAWGSFLGQLILRSTDRADALYESMLLRGFSGDMPDLTRRKSDPRGWIVFPVLAGLMLLFRFYPVFSLLAGLFM